MEIPSVNNPMSRPKAPDRIVWVDACKGICIVLVVYGHISGGLGAGGSVLPNSFWLTLRQWVYLFHMPAFFALSGFFAPRLSLLNGWKFLEGRLRTVFYPYVIWTFIIVGAQYAMARFVNNPVDFHRALFFLFEPYGYGLWFLHALFLISTIFYFLNRYLKSGPIMVGFGLLFSFLASRNIFGFWPNFNTAMEFFIFYAAAACAPAKMHATFLAVKPFRMLAFSAALMTLVTFLFVLGWYQVWFMSLVTASTGIMGVAFLSIGVGQKSLGIFWAFLGSYSLEIYLGHPLWGTLARVVLERARFNSAAGLVLGAVVLAVAGSLAVGVLCRSFHFPYLFRLPNKKPVVA